MPKLGGHELCVFLKSRGRSARIPVLFMSGLMIGPENHVIGKIFGTVTCLDKPIDPGELLAAIDEALAERMVWA